ncbi:trigger factor [Desertibaculum subflavum]|uniref:trigger factor n=1 Tax=Desertibaculum subflavum TaxID=2268458 RepID=UPI000E672613
MHQVTVTASEGLKREFKVVVGRADIDKKADDKLEELNRKVRMPGFRPGKVPLNLLRKQYGRAVLGEVLEETVNEVAQKAMQEHSIRPALQPKIDIQNFEDGKDLEYTMSLEVLPEVEPGDFSGVAVERLVVDVTDDKITEGLDRIAKGQRAFKPIETPRPAEKGDVVVVDFTGRLDGEVFEGGEGKDLQIEIGAGSLLPDFEAALVGMSAGDTKKFPVAFPADYRAEKLAGKTAEFEATVKEIRVADAVAIDDELAKKLGLQTLDELKDALKKQYEQEYGQLSRNRTKRALLDELAKRYDFPVPAGLVDLEFGQIWDQVVRDAGSEAAAAASENKSVDEVKAEYRKIAERRVRLGLLLSEVGQRQKIEVTPDEVTRAVLDEARRFPGQERQVLEYYQKNPEAQQRLRAPLYEEKVVDFVLELAKVSERKVSLDELMKDPEETAA